MMRVGLLQCDELRPAVTSVAGDYPDLIEALLPGGFELVPYRADLGDLPASADECAGWVVSGSRRSVYERLPWMTGLGEFIDGLLAAHAPTVGLCFGHQIIASQLGAPIERIGWNLGAVPYDLVNAGGLGVSVETLDLIAVHQDQVTSLPEGTELLATSPSCPVAGIRVDEWLLTLQPHPEFTPAVTHAIVSSNPARFGTEVAERALASLTSAPDNGVAAVMIRAVLDPAARE